MEILTSCNTSALTVYTPSGANPWNEQKVNHLFRRLGYGATKAEVNTALAQTPSALIDSMVDAAIAQAPSPAPSWANMSYNDFINAGLDPDEQIQNAHQEWRLNTMNNLLNNGLHGRMTLFWHNHFVTELEAYYCSNYLYEYWNIIETSALGNFQQFVYDIGLSNAMLIYLNGFQNRANNPNENYARELYELFTLGENNGYTQTDIVETANFICEKLYKYFVSPTVNTAVVSAMASSFQTDFNIANVLRTLFKSEHFFDETIFGSLIKSPFDLTHNFIKTTGQTLDLAHQEGILWLNNNVGQYIFNPVDVAGWQGNQEWINSSTLTGRWEIVRYLMWHIWNTEPELLRSFAVDASDNSNDPYIVAKSIIDRFVPKELHTTADYDVATDIFKGDVPH